jgi:hypothetical protein
MNRTAVNFVVDLIAALLFLGMAATGYILWFALPPGTNKLLSLWGVTRHGWGTVHAWISFALLGALFLHVCLHWQWVVSVVRKRLRAASAAKGGLVRSGLATLLVVALLFGLFTLATQLGLREITNPQDLGVCLPDRPSGQQEGEAQAPASGVPEREDRTSAGSWKDVYPILEKACLSCHGPMRQRGNFRVDRPADFLGTGDRAALIVPGNSAQSPLIAIVSGQRRDIPRPDVHQLSEREVARLRAWIDAGAEW